MNYYSAISPPPLRGFVFRAVRKHDTEADEQPFYVTRHPIIGVVVVTKEFDYPIDQPSHGEIHPVIYMGDVAGAIDGGMHIYEPLGYGDDLEFSVVWCHWPAEEDERRFQDIVTGYIEPHARLRLEHLRRQEVA